MSEIKLNLTDAQLTIHGTIHGSVADRIVAALSAEPETIEELEAALARYIKPEPTIGAFAWFHTDTEIDTEPWDAGLVVIDLAARIVAFESTYSRPGPQGEVLYHNGQCASDISVLYRVPEDWLFLNSMVDYEHVRQQRRAERAAKRPLDGRAILYGRPLLEFIAHEVAQTSVCRTQLTPLNSLNGKAEDSPGTSAQLEQLANSAESLLYPNKTHDTLIQEVSALHARWLMSPRDDLQGQAPRDLLLAKQDFIDYDLHTRQLQWSFLNEGPPCLATDSFAYQFAGFGTHEWVIYYDLVRHLLWNAVFQIDDGARGQSDETTIAFLEKLKTDWLEHPQRDYDGRIPALLIENERKRLPIAMLGRDMVIDEDCPVCQMMGAETGFGLEVGFWHLDAAHMDYDFAFSDSRTCEEWEAENRRREQFNEEFNRRWEERQQGIAGGEPLAPGPFFDLELPLNINVADSEDALESDLGN